MTDWITIITSASVATIVASGIGVYASWRQRVHERKMAKLADSRELRDRKSARLWVSLRAVAQVGIDLTDAIRELSGNPRHFLPETQARLAKFDSTLEPVRADLVLDA